MRTADARWGATHCMGDATAAVAADASNATPTTLQEGTSVAVAAIAGDLAVSNCLDKKHTPINHDNAVARNGKGMRRCIGQCFFEEAVGGDFAMDVANVAIPTK